MFTGGPSKGISPLSIGWTAAMHFVSVDLPAPLSPTRAMTSPGDTWKSTSNSAWTAPKLFETPCSSSTGVSLTFSLSSSPWPKAPRAPRRGALAHSLLLQTDLLAVRRDVAGADVLDLREVRL